MHTKVFVYFGLLKGFDGINGDSGLILGSED